MSLVRRSKEMSVGRRKSVRIAGISPSARSAVVVLYGVISMAEIPRATQLRYRSDQTCRRDISLQSRGSNTAHISFFRFGIVTSLYRACKGHSTELVQSQVGNILKCMFYSKNFVRIYCTISKVYISNKRTVNFYIVFSDCVGMFFLS